MLFGLLKTERGWMVSSVAADASSFLLLLRYRCSLLPSLSAMSQR